MSSAGHQQVISRSSAGHQHSGISWNDIHFKKDYEKWVADEQSKTANALFSLQLDRFTSKSGIHAYAVHSGKIITPLQRHLDKKEMVDAGWIDEHGNSIDPTFKTPSQGAATPVWAATSPKLDGMGGLYCEDCDVAQLNTTPRKDLVGVNTYAVDPDEASRLWHLSAELTGVDAISSPRN